MVSVRRAALLLVVFLLGGTLASMNTKFFVSSLIVLFILWFMAYDEKTYQRSTWIKKNG